MSEFQPGKSSKIHQLYELEDSKALLPYIYTLITLAPINRPSQLLPSQQCTGIAQFHSGGLSILICISLLCNTSNTSRTTSFRFLNTEEELKLTGEAEHFQ